MRKSIFRLAKNFINKDLKKQVNFEAVEKHLNNIGYIVMFYDENHTLDILKDYELVKYSKTCNAFTLKDDDTKIVFINKKLSSNEMLYAILHETAHIILKHLEGKRIVCNERFQEIEAEAFVYEVLCPHKKKHILVPCLVSILIGFMLGGSFACTYLDVDTSSVNDITYVEEEATEISAESELETEYVLVTPSGTKFHRSDCRYVKGKECTEYLREDALNKYAPCSVCKP